MKDFLKYVLATIVGIILASILFFIIFISTLSALVSSGEKPASISANSVLVLKAGIEIPDRGNPAPFSGFDPVNFEITSVTGLNDILADIKKAESDNKIKGILIENGLSAPGWATTEEIRNAILEFKSSGKFVIAYSDYVLLQEGYYLSTSANRIFISPASTVDFKGLSGDVLFYKKALDKLGVEVQVTRHGKFKGAVEPFILDKLSKENEEQIRSYVGSIWNHAIDKISEARHLTTGQLNNTADSLVGYTADGALSSKLVDGLLYRDALIDTLKSLSGLSKNDKINLVSMAKYTKVPDPLKMVSAKNKIAVVYASGTIVMGKGNDTNIGGNSYGDMIRKLRKDSTIKAIVLRVNSPGGNAIASDLIWREVELTAKEKPVVVSMGNYAASGGYYISAAGTKILADPTTITGSIGVFGLIPNTSKLLNEKLGISTQTVNTNRNSDFPSVTRPMTGYEKEVMQHNIDGFYKVFIDKVAVGRKLTPARVDSIAQGRVWGATSATGIGLVDEIGGLNDAVKEAASLARIETYSLKELPEPEDPYTRIIRTLSGDVSMRLLKNSLGEYRGLIDQLKGLEEFSGVQARMPYMIEVH